MLYEIIATSALIPTYTQLITVKKKDGQKM